MRNVALACVALALLVPLVPSPASGLPPGGLFGGELRVALQAAPSLDPLQFAQNRMAQDLAYDSLTRLGTDMRPVPWLASAWSVDEVAATMTFTLRSAVWPDTSSSVTAQDVAWSYGKYLTAGLLSGFTVAVVNPTTVRFTFTAGGGEFLGNGGTLPVAWRNLQDAETSNGPFVGRSQTATRLELGANLLHWNGRPYLDRIVFLSPYTLLRNPDGSTQANDAACALMKGQVHLIGWTVSATDLTTERDCAAGFGGWADGVNRTLLNPDPDRTVPFAGVSEDPGLTFLHLGMNALRSPLSDPVFRQAVSRAIDRDLIAGTFGGAIEPKTDIADSVVSPANLAWFNASVPRYRVPRVVIGGVATPTLEGVNDYLDAAGYLDRDGDGWRDRPDGTPFNFTLLTRDQASDPRVAKYLDFMTKFRAIGVNVVQEAHPPAELAAIVASDAYDLFVDVETVRGEPAFLRDLFRTGAPGNVVNLAAPALDALLDRAADALNGTARHQAILDAQGWLVENAPLAPIVHFRASYSYDRQSFEGWVGGLGGIANFWSFVSVHVTQEGPLTLTVDAYASSLRSGSSTTVVVRATDVDGNPVQDVLLELSGTGLAVGAGVTDAQGVFTTQLTAPDVTAVQDVAISVDASKPGYGYATATKTLAIHPLVRGLRVELLKGTSQLDSGNTTYVRVLVTDDLTALPVDGASVAVEIAPADFGGTVAQASGTTDGSGTFETTFAGDAAVASRFVITATATKAGYEDGVATTSVEVSPRSQGGGPPVTPALDTLSMVATVGGMAALFGAWQRRKWVRRKP